MTPSELKDIRTKNGLKQSDIADILGIKQSYVSDMEQCKKPISKDTVIKLKKHFGYENEETEHKVSDSQEKYTNKHQEDWFVDVMRKQADSLAKKDEQMDRLITLLENQLNKK